MLTMYHLRFALYGVGIAILSLLAACATTSDHEDAQWDRLWRVWDAINFDRGAGKINYTQAAELKAARTAEAGLMAPDMAEFLAYMKALSERVDAGTMVPSEYHYLTMKAQREMAERRFEEALAVQAIMANSRPRIVYPFNRTMQTNCYTDPYGSTNCTFY